MHRALSPLFTLLAVGLLGAAVSAAQPPRLEAGAFVNLATAGSYRFVVHGAAPGRRFEYRITGPGAPAIAGAGRIGADPHAEAVDIARFGEGPITVEVRLAAGLGRDAVVLHDTVVRDTKAPGLYL